MHPAQPRSRHDPGPEGPTEDQRGSERSRLGSAGGVTNVGDPNAGPSGESEFDADGMGIDPNGQTFQVIPKAYWGFVPAST